MTAWLGVVSADHVARAVDLGVAQIGHGRKTGLARMDPGDLLVYYSARETIGGDPLRAFTAIGRVADGDTVAGGRGRVPSVASKGPLRHVGGDRSPWPTSKGISISAGVRTGGTSSAAASWS